MADKDFDYGLPLPGVMGEDPELDTRLLWYSYLHVTGHLKTKRYMSYLSYKDAHDSDFVEYVTPIYDASNRQAAEKEGLRLLRAHGPGRYRS